MENFLQPSPFHPSTGETSEFPVYLLASMHNNRH